MKFFSLRLKLIISFLFIVILIGAAGIYTLIGLRSTKESLLQTTQADLERIENLQEIRFIATEFQRDSLNYFSGFVPTHENKPFASYASEVRDSLSKQLDTYEQVADSSEKNTLATLRPAIETMIQHAEVSLPASPTKAKLQQFEEDYMNVSAKIDSLLQTEEQRVATSTANADRNTTQLITLSLLFTSIAGIAAIITGVAIASIITKYLTRLQEGAESIANGNFSKTISITTHDEIGNLALSFNKMARSLQESYHRIALEKKRDETLIENMGEGVVGLDHNGQVILINPAAALLFNIGDNKNVIGSHFTQTVTLYDKDAKELPEKDRPSTLSLSTGKPISDIYTIRDNDARKRILAISANPISLEGKISGTIIVARDVTKEKEIDRMKTEFISLASHQLRTPLSAIKWYTEMLLSGDAGKLQNDQIEFAQSIESSTERMIELVTSLLNISRIESGRILVAPQLTDIKELVSGIVTDLKGKTEEKKQTLIISVHEDLPKVMLDPRLIGQVYMNLLTNAIKYTPKEGEITVFVSRKGEEIISQVTDTGYGIPKRQQGRVFEKFFRAENIVKHETDGTGLGLYLIKAIIESSNGKIWFESEEGKGTTFWFSLPLSGMKAKKGEVTLDD